MTHFSKINTEHSPSTINHVARVISRAFKRKNNSLSVSLPRVMNDLKQAHFNGFFFLEKSNTWTLLVKELLEMNKKLLIIPVKPFEPEIQRRTTLSKCMLTANWMDFFHVHIQMLLPLKINIKKKICSCTSSIG